MRGHTTALQAPLQHRCSKAVYSALQINLVVLLICWLQLRGQALQCSGRKLPYSVRRSQEQLRHTFPAHPHILALALACN